jgi:hypothetical protein
MTTGAVDPLVTEYLDRLAAAAARLPADRRAELLAEIGEHIEAARAAGAASDQAALRTLLDRLGDPAEIVAVAAAEPPGPAEPSVGAAGAAVAPARVGVGLETAAVLMLTLGSLIPVLGWLAGAALLWASSRWTRREKLLGTLVVPGGPGLLVVFALAVPTQTCMGATSSDGSSIAETCSGFAFPPLIGIPLTLIVLVAPFVVAAVLLRRARSRAYGWRRS